jgi:hypothetical protein
MKVGSSLSFFLRLTSILIARLAELLQWSSRVD